MSSRSRLAVALASTAIVCYVLVGTWLGRVFGDSSYAQLSIFAEVINLVITHYVEPINLERTMHGAEFGMTEALDGDSCYLDAEDFKELRQGPGEAEADVGLVITRRLGFLMVVAALPDSPAARAKLRPGDILKVIDGHHSRTLGVPVGERLLRGAPGSVVRLTILRRSNDPLEMSLVRERPHAVPPQSRMVAGTIGYLKLASFGDGAAEGVRTELNELRRTGAEKLVLDLRSAAAGQPGEAIKVAQLFVKEGVVARYVTRGADEQLTRADAGLVAWDLPVAALVDTGTAGPGEIVASALADNARATLVGRHTFGRTGVQRAIPLPEGGLWLTVGKYQTPKGEAIHGEGLEPNVSVAPPEGDADEEQAAPPGDPMLDKAIEVLSQEQSKAA